jgi:DNA repair exonuclease SbcCD ATPase subunit
MFDKTRRIEERDKNREVLKETLKAKDEIIARKLDRIQKTYDNLEGQIRDLQEQKSRYLEGAMTKEETLQVAREALEQGRKDVLQHIIRYIETYRQRGATPFRQSDVSVHLYPAEKAYRLFYFAISDKDIEEAVSALDEGGMPASEREAKIAEIEEKIQDLRRQIEKELEAEKNLKD